MLLTYRTFGSDADLAARTAPPSLVSIYHARFARSLAGAVLTVLATTALAWSITFDRSTWTESDYGPAALLLVSWPVALGTYLLARALLRATRVARRLDIVLAERSLFGLEVASIALPLAGIAFAAPLTLHAAVGALKGDLNGFVEWMKFSAIIVGHAHLALAAHGWMFARELHRKPSTDEQISVRVERSWLGGLAVMCGIVPGVVLIGIPPLLVLVTGVVFVPVSYFVLKTIFANERATIRKAFAAADGYAVSSRL